jgi:hypothetical protein
VILKNGTELHHLDTWFDLAGPKSRRQWKDERSAKESARAWLSALPNLPSEVSETIVGHRDFSEILQWTAEPEAVVRFDPFRGEPANLDVLVRGEDANGPVLVAVEAKADETFGGTVAETVARATERLDSNPRSKGMLRIERLVRGLFGLDPEEIASILRLRYQLLTATAAALADSARTGSPRAVVFIHEFVTPLTTDDLQDLSARRSPHPPPTPRPPAGDPTPPAHRVAGFPPPRTDPPAAGARSRSPVPVRTTGR